MRIIVILAAPMTFESRQNSKRIRSVVVENENRVENVLIPKGNAWCNLRYRATDRQSLCLSSHFVVIVHPGEILSSRECLVTLPDQSQAGGDFVVHLWIRAKVLKKIKTTSFLQYGRRSRDHPVLSKYTVQNGFLLSSVLNSGFKGVLEKKKKKRRTVVSSRGFLLVVAS